MLEGLLAVSLLLDGLVDVGVAAGIFGVVDVVLAGFELGGLVVLALAICLGGACLVGVVWFWFLGLAAFDDLSDSVG